MARGHGTNGFGRIKRRYRINLMENEKKHELLKKLYLEREHYLKNSSRKKSNMYRYFNITYENIEHHLNRTMDEFFEDLEKDKHNTLYIVDGNAFSGRYADLRIPVPREWASFEFEGQNPHGLEPVSKMPSDVKPNFGNELLESIYSLLNSPESGDEKHVSPKNSTSKEAIELYDEVGDYDYQEFERFKTYRKDYLQNIEFKSNDESKKQRELLHNLMIQPTAFPSYLDPDNPILRTGRRRELQRKRDSGRLQRKRWHMDVPSEDDIARGRRRVGDNVTKEFLDSIEWEQPLPTYHDSNFFKRSFYESGFGGDDRTLDSYFDVQFIGATDAYPFAVSAGMQFAWPIYW
ncbi:hypothetical protein BEWA_029280 [Theileria equi strain WA]|uniref:Uncharacterized protein n=1 Tax=Theileria equi strain WA TaxID=1537102 RepID=L0AXU1_THEEQ|nr:hypothetical protein BEWA_029280 [Theileria equi strain WA]AFZ80078.1 hypothetical protein BEWA_029280 [Theileria equi strain WA]|eukprot:XP_004829744.1 hypothetical protein BEWA_029280 [Theileria equi strain WA]